MAISPEAQQANFVPTFLHRAYAALRKQSYREARGHFRSANRYISKLDAKDPDTTLLRFETLLGQAWALAAIAGTAGQNASQFDINDAVECLSLANYCLPFDKPKLDGSGKPLKPHPHAAYVAEKLKARPDLQQAYQALTSKYAYELGLVELSKAAAYKTLTAQLKAQLARENQGQTLLHLAIRYRLTKFFLHLYDSPGYLIDLQQLDKQGSTLLDYAKEHQDTKARDMLRDLKRRQQAFEAEREAERVRFEQRFDELRRRVTPISISPLHKQQEKILKGQLESLLDEHPFEGPYLAFNKAIGGIARGKAESTETMDLLKSAFSLRKRLLPPEQLIKPFVLEEQSAFYQFRYKFGSPAVLPQFDTKALSVSLTEIAEFREQLKPGDQSQHKAMDDALARITACYQAFLKHPVDSRATFYSQDIRRYVKPQELRGFFPPSNNKTAVNNGNKHPVHEHKGMHLKLDPSFPGAEFMTHSLNTIITGTGSPPTRLAKVCYKNQAKLYIVSKTVEGIDLEKVNRWHPEFLDKLCPTNFSNMSLLSFLTDPQDGHGRNYQVQFIFDDTPQRNLVRTKLVGIDNDLNFAIPIIANGHGHAVDIKCMLYALPAMKRSIDKDAKAAFLKLKPATAVVEWLQKLQKQNQHYQALNEEGVLSEKEFTESKLPIKLRPDTAEQLYQKIVHIQKLLLEDTENTLTHNDIFKSLQPVVARVYEAMLKHYQGDAEKVMEELYKEVKPFQGTDTKTIKNWLDVNEPLSPETPDETIKTYLAKQKAAFGEFGNRTQTVGQALDDFVAKHSGESTDALDAGDLLNALGRSPVPVTKLTLDAHSRVSPQDIHAKVIKPLKEKFPGSPLSLRLRGWPSRDAAHLQKLAKLSGVDVELAGADSPEPMSPTLRDDAQGSYATSSSSNHSQSQLSRLFSPIGDGANSPPKIGSPDSPPLAQPSLRLPLYTEQDINDYVNAAITQKGLQADSSKTYQIRSIPLAPLCESEPSEAIGTGASSSTIVKVPPLMCHQFLLPAMDTLSDAHRQQLGQLSLSSLPITFSFDKTTREPTELAALIREALTADSREALEALLARELAQGKRHEILGDHLTQHPTWETLKPVLQTILSAELGVDVVDELMNCMTQERAQARLFFAYNRELIHWLTGELVLDKVGTAYTLTAYTHDPYGGGHMSATVANKIHEVLLRRLQSYDANITLTLVCKESPQSRLQDADDTVSCGVIVAEHLVTLLAGESMPDTPYPCGAKTLREVQQNVMGHPPLEATQRPIRSRLADELKGASRGSSSKPLTLEQKDALQQIWQAFDLLPGAFRRALLKAIATNHDLYQAQDEGYQVAVRSCFDEYPVQLAQQGAPLDESTLALLVQLERDCCHPEGLLGGQTKVLYEYAKSLNTNSVLDEPSAPADIQDPAFALTLPPFHMNLPPGERRLRIRIPGSAPLTEVDLNQLFKVVGQVTETVSPQRPSEWSMISKEGVMVHAEDKGERVVYQIPDDPYTMVVYAMKASSARYSYLPFIRLLTDPSFAAPQDETLEARIVRVARIRSLINTHIVVSKGQGLIPEGIPLYCRQHFTPENVHIKLMRLAGSVPLNSKDALFGNNLALIAAIFTAPYVLPQEDDDEEVNLSRQPAQDIYAYFATELAQSHSQLAEDRNILGYCAKDVWTLLNNPDELPQKALIPGVDNAELKALYEKLVSLWRRLHGYLRGWEVRRYQQLDLKDRQALVDRSLYSRLRDAFSMFLDKADYGLFEEEIFEGRKEAALRGLHVVNVGLMLPIQPFIQYLEKLENEVSRPGILGFFFDGSMLRYIFATAISSFKDTPLGKSIDEGRLIAAIDAKQLDYERDKDETQAKIDAANARAEKAQKAEEEAKAREEQERQEKERERQEKEYEREEKERERQEKERERQEKERERQEKERERQEKEREREAKEQAQQAEAEANARTAAAEEEVAQLRRELAALRRQQPSSSTSEILATAATSSETSETLSSSSTSTTTSASRETGERQVEVLLTPVPATLFASAPPPASSEGAAPQPKLGPPSLKEMCQAVLKP